MDANETKKALERIMKGEKAKLVVAPANWAAASAIHSKLPPKFRSLLTLVLES